MIGPAGAIAASGRRRLLALVAGVPAGPDPIILAFDVLSGLLAPEYDGSFDAASYDLDRYREITPINVGAAFTGDDITYAIASGALPAGLQIDSATGLITGTPDDVLGNYTFTVSATNAAGTVATGTLTTVVVAGGVLDLGGITLRNKSSAEHFLGALRLVNDAAAMGLSRISVAVTPSAEITVTGNVFAATSPGRITVRDPNAGDAVLGQSATSTNLSATFTPSGSSIDIELETADATSGGIAGFAAIVVGGSPVDLHAATRTDEGVSVDKLGMIVRNTAASYGATVIDYATTATANYDFSAEVYSGSGPGRATVRESGAYLVQGADGVHVAATSFTASSAEVNMEMQINDNTLGHWAGFSMVYVKQQSGPTVTLTGNYGTTQFREDYQTVVNIDASAAEFTLDPSTQRYPFMIDPSVSGITILGGKINGNYPQAEDWETAYVNGVGIRIDTTQNVTIRGWDIDKPWDSIRFSGNCDGFLIDECKITLARDDAGMENDFYSTGTIRNSYATGFVFISTASDTADGTGKTVTVEGCVYESLLYLYKGNVTHQSPFKVEATGPAYVVTNSTIAIARVDHEGFGRLTEALGRMTVTNSYWLNLTDDALPNDYPDVVGAGFTLLNGQAARDQLAADQAAWIATYRP